MENKSYEKEDDDYERNINVKKQRFPFCIVWTSIPCLTHLIPWIGHTGICTRTGVIHDFAGPYTIMVDDFAFGKPMKYIQLEIEESRREEFDLAIEAADKKFSKEMHNLFCHCAYALSQFKYKGKSNWNMFDIWLMSVCNSRYVKSSDFLKVYLGFFCCMGIIVALYLAVHFAAN